ncbi:hypothetical protein [Paenibacillus alvei]|uniref:hypothetical protein n=1 Tax=Paenibacillus alvei TaxID=44250 RepID=UPI0019D66E3C|nr:hypothetical protein [Paenibacillus alvei]
MSEELSGRGSFFVEITSKNRSACIKLLRYNENVNKMEHSSIKWNGGVRLIKVGVCIILHTMGA